MPKITYCDFIMIISIVQFITQTRGKRNIERWKWWGNSFNINLTHILLNVKRNPHIFIDKETTRNNHIEFRLREDNSIYKILTN